MNTMYRNIKDNMENQGGYEQVKQKFLGTGSQIIDKNDIYSGNDLQKNICCLLNLKEDVSIKGKLESLKAGLTSLKGELFSKVKNTPSTGGEITVKENYDKLLKIFDNMQKGALLHVHSTVGLNVDNLFQLILKWNENNAENDDMRIYYLIIEQTIESKTYPNHILMYKKQFTECKIDEKNIKLFSDEDMDTLRPSLCFEEKKDWVEFGKIFARTKSLFVNKDFYHDYHKIFFEECMKNNIFYVEIRTGFEEFTDFSKKEDIKKGILFLRPDFKLENFFYHENMLTDVSPVTPDTEFLEIIKSAEQEAIKSIKKQFPLCTRADNFKVKVILTANRITKDRDVVRNVVNKMDAAIVIKNMKDKNNLPEIIGFDLVAQELQDIGTTEYFSSYIYRNFGSDYTAPIAKDKPEYWDELIRNRRIDLIRFFLHDGENMGNIKKSFGNLNKEVDISDNAITGAICSRHRIGHGFKMGANENYKKEEITKEQRLMGNLISDYILYGCSTDVGTDGNYPVINNSQKYHRKDGIAEPVIEFCPISNQLLDYTQDLTTHPAKVLTENGIFAVVANDDPQIFDNQGLSYDYLMAYINDVLTYEQIKISVFLGYFYRKMSDYYYIKEIYTDEDKYIWVVNDRMNYGTETDNLEVLNDVPSNVTEYAIINKAIEEFKKDWLYLNTYIKEKIQ